MSEDGEGTVQNQEQVPEGQAQDQGNQEGSQQQEALTKEAVQQMIAEATARAVVEAKEVGRRELQSQQDKNKLELAKAQREARIAAKTLEATQESIKGLDQSDVNTIELARLRAEQQARAEADKEDTTTAQNEAYAKTLREGLESHLDSIGIKKDDPRIDWAMDAPDYLAGRSRFDASVAQILKEDRTKETNELSQRLKALEDKLKGEDNQERNSVETTLPGGGGVTQSDQQFLKDWGSGKLPATKDNFERAIKLQNKL